MTAHMSKDLRERIVAWRAEGKTIREIADLSGRGRSTISDFLKKYNDRGVIQNPVRETRGRKRLLSMGDQVYLKSNMDANPALTLDEVKQRLEIGRAVAPSIPTVHRSLARMALNSKTLAKVAAERNEELRATWRVANGHFPLDHYVWLDESAVDELTCQRRRGWARRGVRPVVRHTFIRGTRYSVLPALWAGGVFALDIFEGSVNKERFIRFLRDQVVSTFCEYAAFESTQHMRAQVPHLNVFPAPRSVVVMDNCAIHHDAEIRQLVEGKGMAMIPLRLDLYSHLFLGARLIYLPPYSPDMNPIEQTFSFMKKHLQRQQSEYPGPHAREWFIDSAVRAVTSELAEGWARNCGYH